MFWWNCRLSNRNPTYVGRPLPFLCPARVAHQSGTFGRVKLARYRETGAVYALKIIQKTLVVEFKQEENVLFEKQALTELDHPFVLKLWTTFKDRDCIFFLMELVPGGELYLHRTPPPPPPLPPPLQSVVFFLHSVRFALCTSSSYSPPLAALAACVIMSPCSLPRSLPRSLLMA